MRRALAAAFLLLALGGAGCIHEDLAPFMERTGRVLVELGKNKLNRGEGGLATGDLVTGLGLILGGSILTGGGAWALRNGRRNGGRNDRPGS